jgi:hypothetical protein
MRALGPSHQQKKPFPAAAMKESHQHFDITEKEWQAMGHEKGRLPANFLPAGSNQP